MQQRNGDQDKVSFLCLDFYPAQVLSCDIEGNHSELNIQRTYVYTHMLHIRPTLCNGVWYDFNCFFPCSALTNLLDSE